MWLYIYFCLNQYEQFFCRWIFALPSDNPSSVQRMCRALIGPILYKWLLRKMILEFNYCPRNNSELILHDNSLGENSCGIMEMFNTY